MKERKDRVDDALHATRAAVEEGILPVPRRHCPELTAAFGGPPALQIAINAGDDGSIVIGKRMIDW